MRKALLALTLLTLSNVSLANVNQQKISMVKKLYTKSGLQQGYDFVSKLATPSLKATFARDAKIAEKEGGIACLDYDVIVQG